MHCFFQRQALAAFCFTMGAASSALAVPYASGVRDIGSNMWEFVLNEDADEVTVLRDGGNPVSLGTTAGRLTFDMSGFSDFEIRVSKAAAAGWTEIHGAGNPFTNFTIPSGLAINNDPTSAYFGTVYVGQASASATVAGRPMGDGVYALTADMIGVDLANDFAVVADPNDTTQAKAPNWSVSGSDTASPWRITLDAGGNLIVSDWSDAHGGIKYATPDLTTGGLVLGGVDFDGNPMPEAGPAGGVFSQEMDQFGRIPLHGSIASKPYVTGTVGVDLTIWAMDEDLDTDFSVPGTDYNNIWRWDVGSATSYDALAPELEVNSISVASQSLWISAFNGVRAGAHFDPDNNKWYMVQNRFDGFQDGLVIVTPDGVDGNSPVVEWASLQFSIDNNVDGNSDLEEIQDVFLRIGDVTMSPDGTKLLLHRISSAAETNPLEGNVIIIPLDENGIPDIQVEDGVMTNVETITITGNNLGHSSGAQLEFDAAGNLYIANSGFVEDDPDATAQLVQVWSPGGSFTAKTTSDGTFSLESFEPPMGLIGDYNNDGEVDAADYTVWRDNVGAETLLNRDPNIAGAVGDDDYNAWVANFGMTIGSGSSAAVPEPGTIGLALVTALVLGAVIAVRRS